MPYKDKNKARACIRRYCRNLRTAVLAYLGNKCIRCGFSDHRALQIDHIRGGGCKELKKLNVHGVCAKILSGKYDSEYQLLCANCNWIKRAENHEHNYEKY